MKEERLKKLNSKLKEIIWIKLNEIIQDFQQDFWIITTNSVKLAPDLSYIDIFVSSIKNQELLCKTLAKYATELKQNLNQKMTLRKTPIIRFRYDKTLENTTDLMEKIKSLDIK